MPDTIHKGYTIRKVEIDTDGHMEWIAFKSGEKNIFGKTKKMLFENIVQYEKSKNFWGC